ncbi:hypothetical protein TrLO_g9590 [Triparma laevis f. longispina]|uniref:Uncharacterized protein n=1 Tax=Triparma laevis f. longispina TaxID=1714387 RepID=A0A9W7C0J1_9STRA|nr:hypothetical protein TrLO_g9590 [Triparma laevis f. longispina]
MSKQMGLITSRVKSFFRSSKRGSKKVFVTQMNRPSVGAPELSTVESRGREDESFSEKDDPEKGMSARDLAQYELEQIETVKANGEKSVRMQFSRRNSQYHQGTSVLKHTNSPKGKLHKGGGKRNLHGWRTQRRLNIEKSLKENSISEKQEFNNSRNSGSFNESDELGVYGGGGVTPDSHSGGSREYGMEAPPSTISLDGEELGFVENHRPLELDCITGEGEGGEADDVGAIYLPTTPGPERIRRKSLSDLTDLATTQQDGLGSPPTQTGNVKETVASPDGSFRGAVQRAVEPDVDHVKVRIHPGLIVNVIENVLNFDKDEDEGGGAVICTDIWYTKDEISEFRVQGNEEQFQEELTTAQDNMKKLAVDKDDPNYKREQEMSKMIAKLLETDWEEGMSKSEKSGKQTWDKGGGESGGSGRMFYMGDDGRATFENEDDAEEDRTWETTSKRRERRQTRGTIRSRRGTKVDLSKEGGGSNRASMDEADLKDIMGKAKAETVAAIMAIEALNFDNDD